MQHRTPAEQVLFSHDLFPLIAMHLPTVADFGRLKSISRDAKRCGVIFEGHLMNNPVNMLRFMMTMDKIQLSYFLRYLRRYAFYDCDRIFYHQALQNKEDHVAIAFAALMMPISQVVVLAPRIQLARDYFVTQGFNPDIAFMQSLQFLTCYAKNGKKAFKEFSQAYFNLRGLVAQNFKLKNVSLAGACFERADLTNAIFDFAYLRHANFHLATLQGTSMMGASLSGADLSYADLRGATISGANMCNANLCGTDLSTAKLTVNPMTVDLYDDDNCKAPNMEGARFNKQTMFPRFFNKSINKLVNMSKPVSGSGCTIC